jgi:hypothetical protein
MQMVEAKEERRAMASTVQPVQNRRTQAKNAWDDDEAGRSRGPIDGE